MVFHNSKYPVFTTPISIVNTTIVIISSITAAPIIMLPSFVPITFKSSKISAFTPIEVAIREVPTKRAIMCSKPNQIAVIYPKPNGKITPKTATRVELVSIFLNSFRLSDKPAENKRNKIPTSAILLTRGCISDSLWNIIKPIFPIIAPSINSPKITGCLSFFDKNLPIKAAVKTIITLTIKSINSEI